MVNNAHHNYYFQLSVTTVASRLEKKISDQDGINDLDGINEKDGINEQGGIVLL